MPSPFPGMDPCLEAPEIWPDVHHGLISNIQSDLNTSLGPRYVARVELRVYISDDDDPGREVIIPDIRVEAARRRKKAKRQKGAATATVAEPLIIPFLLDTEIKEARVEILHREPESLVTVIEVLSPANKIRGSRGRASFMEKRQEIVAGPVHWVEIDLLRRGEPSVTRPALVPCDYRVMVVRAGDRLHSRYWPLSVRQSLPAISIPLRGGDADVSLALKAVLQATYDRAAFDRSIDYRTKPNPPLAAEDAAWADRLLREHGLRNGPKVRR